MVLVLAEVIGGAVIGRRVRGIEGQLSSVADGPVDGATRSLVADRQVWLASHLNTATIVTVVLLMTTKPSGVVSVVVVLVGAVIGLASALPFAEPAAVPA